MTKWVIMVHAMTHTVSKLLSQWPNRQSVHEDVRSEHPDLDMVAVHRWFQRESVSPRYWQSILAGAVRRGINVNASDLVAAHACAHSAGHAAPKCETDAA